MDSRPDSTSKRNKNQIVPTEIRAWVIDETYGNVSDIHVDTLHHLYQNKDLPEGLYGHYNSLGNVGSPRMSRIFMERPMMSNFYFVDPYDMFFTTTDKFRFYNTKSPFMNVDYNFNGSKTTGSDHVKVTYTNNAGKRTNIGAMFDYIYGQGYYDNQSTSFMNASVWASHIGDKYNFHMYFMHNFMKQSENGGIQDEGYITNPENMPNSYGSSDIPTNLTNTWNRQEHDVFLYNHHYNIGFYKTIEIDSVKTEEVFVPVSKIFHTLKVQNLSKNYRAYTEPKEYHSYTYLPGDSAQDRTKDLNVKNIVGLSLCEGFNKWALFGLNAYVGFDYNKYILPDSTMYGGYWTNTNRRIGKTNESESNVLIGGQIIRSQGTAIHYNINGEYVLSGPANGQFDINAHGEVNIPLLGDTAQVCVNAYIKNMHPSYYFRHYHGKHAWWDINTDKEFRQRVEGIITVPHTQTKLTIGVENIKNFCYFQNNGLILENGKVTNNIAPMQNKGNIQVVSANLRQDFLLGILHWENDITYQTCTNKDVLPLPTLNIYTNLYLRFKIAQVLKTEFGADMKYFTEYNAPDYSPVLGMFMNQHNSKLTKIGNYPIISVYANFDLKRTRFYVQYYHANQSDGRYFWGPLYPINPKGIHFGLSWNFYN